MSHRDQLDAFFNVDNCTYLHIELRCSFVVSTKELHSLRSAVRSWLPHPDLFHSWMSDKVPLLW